MKMIQDLSDDGREQIHQINPTNKLPNTWWNQQAKVVEVSYPWLTKIHNLEEISEDAKWKW